MDLLGSIIDSMDKPPALSEKEKLAKKSELLTYIFSKPFISIALAERKEELEKRQKEEKENYKRFKEKVEDKLKTYFEEPRNMNLKFSPMHQIYRSIV